MTTTTKAPNIELADIDTIVAGIGREERHTIAILQAIQALAPRELVPGAAAAGVGAAAGRRLPPAMVHARHAHLTP